MQFEPLRRCADAERPGWVTTPERSPLYTSVVDPSFRSGMPESIVQGWQTVITTDAIVSTDDILRLGKSHESSVQCQAPFFGQDEQD